MAIQKTIQKQPQTIVINNFSGRLTRILNGDLNSGFAKFTNSFGYDPFSKPLNLTWFESASEITGPISALPLAAKTTAKSGVTNAEVFVMAQNGNLYTMQSSSNTTANVDSVIGISSVKAGGATYNYGASLDFFTPSASVGGAVERVYVGHDIGVNRINFDGTADTFVGTAGYYNQSIARPLKQFIGKLYFSNKNTIGAIGATGTVISTVASVNGTSAYSDLSPPLPTEATIQDMDVTPDGNYLLMTSSNQNNYVVTGLENNYFNLAVDSALFKWNGTDGTVTAYTSLPGYNASALQTYLNNNIFFSENAFGSSVADEVQKILTLPNNKPPAPNATGVNGNFLTWLAVESEPASNRTNATLYYFGALDQETPPGLYRLLRHRGGSLTGYVYQTPLNTIVANSHTGINPSYSSVVSYGYGKHYLGVGAITTGGTVSYVLLRFLLNSTGSGTPQAGVYETQTQLFSKRISISQIRVYAEATAAGNGFQLDLVDAAGALVTNGTFTYSYAAGSDITLLKGPVERINFNPGVVPLYAVGVRITNTGTTNMTIKKVELDYMEEGK